MINEFDYDEDVMLESIPPINVPHLCTPVVTSRVQTSEQDGVFMDLQRLIEEERLRE